MDIVVVLALVVLTSVFILSLIILVITCQRRRQSKAKSKILVPFATAPQRFSHNTATDDVDEIDSMEQLDDLLGELLDKNEWLFEARGIMQHVVAVLTLTKRVTGKLRDVQLPTTPSPFHDAINMAMRNIYPRFDDLVESIAAQPIDLRLLEARALSVGTVAWSLYLPYTLLDERNKEEIQRPLNELNVHLVTIRTAAHLIQMADLGANDKLDIVDLKDQLLRMRRQVRGDLQLDEEEYETEDDGVEDQEEEPTGNHHEKTPLVESEAVIDMIELTRVPLIEQEHLLKSNGVIPSSSSSERGEEHLHSHSHHPHKHLHHMTNGSLNTVEESNEDDHHGEG
uniref:Transmembrane protein 98 n=1 Tax=Caenorhabditis tropicalis TaxID=1561998 RepID=A0A1I7TM56_9PELO